MRVAVLHNVRAARHDGGPDDLFEEYDDPITIRAICDALADLGVEPIPLEADRRLPWRLESARLDFVFNIAEFEGRRCREANPAAMCELLGLPYTGSDPLTLALALDKSLSKRVVSPELAVAPGVLLSGPEDEPALARLPYPAIVKPNDEGSSKGIRDGRHVAADAAEAAALGRRLADLYRCPALVETFLPGPEVTVGVAGNGSSARVLGMMEISPAHGDAPFVYSVEAKRDWRRRVAYHVPPRLPRDIRSSIGEQALLACRLLGCRDLARVDFRLDARGVPHFLECNPLPGLNPASSDIVLLCAGTTSYGALVRGVLQDAAARQKVVLPSAQPAPYAIDKKTVLSPS